MTSRPGVAMLLHSMLVQVRLLRRSGERLSAGDVRSQPPLVGWIRLFGAPGLRLERSDRVAVLQLPDNRSLELYDAQLTQWDGRGMILGGEERVPGAGRKFERHRQAWWCRPIEAAQVAEVAASRASSPPPLLEEPSDSAWINQLTEPSDGRDGS